MMKIPPKHPNQFEHYEHISAFLFSFVVSGTLGAILGRLVDKLMQKLDPKNKITTIMVFLLQMFINAIVIFVAFKYITIDKLSFDDWISGTFQGIIFITTFFSMQEELFLNLKNALF